MADSNNKQRSGFFSSALGVAKKLSDSGLNRLNQVASDTISKDSSSSQPRTTASTSKSYERPQQVLREYLPTVSRQVLGRHYAKANSVAQWMSPQLSNQVADYFFNQLNQFSSNISSVDSVLDQAGVRDLEMLTQDIDRSKRISQALFEQNKIIAVLQGAFTGATGLLGSGIDVPASLIMSLRMIYQVGRSYGFDLSKESDQDIVQFIFKQIDLGLIAEKQTLLMAVKAISSTLQTHDISQLQQLLGSNHDTEWLKQWMARSGESTQRRPYFENFSILNKLAKLSPVASAGVSAAYSWRLINEVHQKAQQVFSQARHYMIEQKDHSLSALTAYERSLELLIKPSAPLLAESSPAVPMDSGSLNLGEEIILEDHQSISKVKVQKKVDKTADIPTEERVQQGLEHLADQMVEPHAAVSPQQPALQAEEDLADLYATEQSNLEPENDESSVEIEAESDSKATDEPESKQVEKKATKKRNTLTPN